MTSNNRAKTRISLSIGGFLMAAAFAGSAQDAMFVDSTGNVGVGTNVPAKQLHIQGNDSSGSASNNVELRVENTTSTTANRSMMRLINNGGVEFKMQTDSAIWNFAGLADNFVINDVTVSGVPFRVFSNGNLTIGGTLTENSSRAVKHDITELNGNAVLDKLAKLSISQWRYDHSPEYIHAGPMAEDWYRTFGFGKDNKTVAPKDMAAVAMASSQALHRSVRELQDENQRLRERLAELENLIKTRR